MSLSSACVSVMDGLGGIASQPFRRLTNKLVAKVFQAEFTPPIVAAHYPAITPSRIDVENSPVLAQNRCRQTD
jgi:hypothetical protein